MSKSNRRELLLSFYGPVSLLFLLSLWAAGLILGFACLHRSLKIPMKIQDGSTGFLTYIYFSGSTFFTLGLGDIVTETWPGKLLTILESGMGLGFLAIVIGYLPVLYQAFSRRELNISLLDARAGSPSTATNLSSFQPFFVNGSVGRLNCSKVICRTLCLPTTAPNTVTSRGWEL